jgi:hypothetical protein
MLSENNGFRLLVSCPSILPSAFPLDGFSWNFVFDYFSKICRENSSFIKIGQEQRVLYMKTDMYFWSHVTQFFLEWEMFHTKVAEKVKQHVLCSITFFFPGNRVVYEGVWRNTAHPGKPKMATQCMHIAGWVPKATETYTEYVILINVSLQQWLHELATLLRCTCTACRVL